MAVSNFKLDSPSRHSDTAFSLVFFVKGELYRFSLVVNKRTIIREQLEHIAETGKIEQVYSRQKQESAQPKWQSKLREEQALIKIWQDATRDDALFLAIAVQLNSQELKDVFDWFSTNLLGHDRSFMGFDKVKVGKFDDQEYVKRYLNFVNIADIGMVDLKLKEHEIRVLGEEDREKIPYKMWDFEIGHYDDSLKIQYFNLQRDESQGTNTLFHLAADFLDALDHGKLLLVDELDDSLHPHLVTYLVNYFNDPINNPKGAQLIFTSHDVTLLRGDTLHPDQVWLCEKRVGQAAYLFPLSTYRVRKGEAKEDRYLAGRYGGLPRVTKTYIAEKLTGRRRGKV